MIGSLGRISFSRRWPTEVAQALGACRFHNRHTACARLLEGGVPYHVVSTIIGRSAATAIRTAKRYGHIGQKAMSPAVEVTCKIRNPGRGEVKLTS
jgi:hypothetical protein